jgi:hypothetical protein
VDNLRGDGVFRAAPTRPIGHETPSLLQQITTAISALNLAGDRVRKCKLNSIAVVDCAFCPPIPERAAKPMGRNVGPTHALQQGKHGHVTKRLAGLVGEDKEFVCTTFGLKVFQDFHGAVA